MANPYAIDLPDFAGIARRNRLQGLAEQDRATQREREQFADQQLRAQVERGNQLRQLAGQAASAATPAERDQFIAQAYGVDPQGAATLGQNLGSADDRRRQRLAVWARQLTSIPEENHSARMWMYQQMRPEMVKLGFDAPPEYTPEVGRMAQAFMDVSSGQAPAQRPPSNVQEWEYYSRLTPEQQSAYLRMKRADPIFKMGDVQMIGDQITRTATPFAEAPGRAQADVQRELSGQAAEKTAMEENVKAASKLADESFKRLEAVKTNIANYDEAIRLIDEGAQTGVIASRLPSVRQASIALDNLQGRLGLDVIGNTTFGALSEAELRFALDTALPQRLDGPALKQWLQQKKAAQQKLAAYLEQAAIFLGTPGNTVKDWIEIQRGGQPNGRPGAQPPQAPTPQPQSGPVPISTPQERDALPPGTQYIAPDGTVRTKR